MHSARIIEGWDYVRNALTGVKNEAVLIDACKEAGCGARRVTKYWAFTGRPVFGTMCTSSEL